MSTILNSSNNNTFHTNSSKKNDHDILKVDAQTVAEILNFENLVYIPYGFLTLPEGKMSSRKGNFVTARDIISQVQEEAYKVLEVKGLDAGLSETEKQQKAKKVALAALKWRILYKDIQKDSSLNIPEILNFSGNTGVYQLYTIVRINGILEKLAQEQTQGKKSEDQKNSRGEILEEGTEKVLTDNSEENSEEKLVQNNQKNQAQSIDTIVRNYLEAQKNQAAINSESREDYYKQLQDLLSPEEKLILEKIMTVSLVLERAKKTHKVHHICNFLYDLATAFNSWYSQVKVIQESADRKLILAIFIWQIQQTMITCLDLLGIKTVDRL